MVKNQTCLTVKGTSRIRILILQSDKIRMWKNYYKQMQNQIYQVDLLERGRNQAICKIMIITSQS
ncbi:alpha-L-rhamnosidase [Sesbania bispinosa]|nr:alpha-L-rhamnosidase [Sesbania bispinosa]